MPEPTVALSAWSPRYTASPPPAFRRWTRAKTVPTLQVLPVLALAISLWWCSGGSGETTTGEQQPGGAGRDVFASLLRALALSRLEKQQEMGC